jgi:uncharacterized protein YmfQ (DUF2313 family)
MGKQLSYKREIVNDKGRYAVVVLQDRTTVGHLPAICLDVIVTQQWHLHWHANFQKESIQQHINSGTIHSQKR